jgi:hypothetical protein
MPQSLGLALIKNASNFYTIDNIFHRWLFFLLPHREQKQLVEQSVQLE